MNQSIRHQVSDYAQYDIDRHRIISIVMKVGIISRTRTPGDWPTHVPHDLTGLRTRDGHSLFVAIYDEILVMTRLDR